MADFSADQLISAIYGQESGSGKADTSSPNYAGAIGPMQVIEPTFNGLKKQGLIPADWSFTNPAHTKAAGEAHVQQLYKQYGGDPRKVAAAYYSGPKAVLANGNIADLRDPLNAQAPTTLGYVADIMRRLGGASAQVSPPALVERAAYQRLADPLDEVMPTRMRLSGSGDKGLPTLNVPANPPVLQVDRVAETQVGVLESQRRTEEESISFLEQSQRAFLGTLSGAALRAKVAQDILGDNLPDPTYKLDPKLLRGLTTAEQDHMIEANNAHDEEHRKFQILDARESQEKVFIKGTGFGLLAGAVAGLPEGAVGGMAAYRMMSLLGAGSAALMAQGRTGAAIASSIGENVLLDTAMAGIQAKIDPFFTASDAVTQVGLGAIMSSAVSVPGLLREGKAHARLQGLMDAQSTQRITDNAAAEARLGPDATPAALGQQVQRMEIERAEAEIDTMRRPPSSPMLPDTVRPDLDEAQYIGGQDQTGISSKELPTYAVISNNYAAKDKGTQGHATQVDLLGAPAAHTDTPEFKELSKDTVLSNDYVVKEPGATGGFDEWALPGNWGTRRDLFSPGGAFEDKINQRTKGLVKSLAELEALKPGVHATADTPAHFLQPMRAARQIATKFLGEDFRIVLGTIEEPGVRGAVLHPTPNSAVIMIDPKLGEVQAVRTMIHELGHMIWHKHLEKMPDSTKQAVDMAYQRFMRAWSSQLGDGAVAVARRFSLLSPEREAARLPASGYIFSRDEHAAEQFVKYIEDDMRAQGIILDHSLTETLKGALSKAIAFITQAGRKLIGVEDEFKAFFDEVRATTAATKPAPVRGTEAAKRITLRRPEQMDAAQGALDSKVALATDPDVQRLGLGIAPMETPQQRAEILLIKDLHEKAKNPAYSVDEARLSKLLSTAMFQGGQSIANTMLRSKNAVMRMSAAMLAESPSGAAGRRGTAAIAKHLHEQAFLGNTVNEVQLHYNTYRKEFGGTLVEDVFGGKVWGEFNKKIARELEARGRGTQVTSHPEVVKAADSLEAAYERMRTAQVSTKTVGWANLPTSSKGYMPHRLSGEHIRNATNAELSALHSALTDQFIKNLDFDATFSDMLASKYIDRVKHRALGGADAPVGAQHIGSSELVEEALQATVMGADEIRAVMKKLMTAGPGHTKKRLQLDLNEEHTLADGNTFRLGDLFEDDQFTLLRSQATRVSGEVALTEYGVFGKAGLDVLRRAASFGPEGAASKAEFNAFDQMAAEFLGSPYGTQSKLVDRVLQANSAARLGGMGFNQFGEYINGVWHVGVGRTMQAIADIPRLLGEVRALARGEAVDNGILDGLEKVYGGAEFGTESYKTVFPFDNRSLDPHTYGQETVTLMDRLLRGASHMQAKLSFWRAIHSVQHRGMAEQIVRKAAVFLKGGRSADVFLKDMGLGDDLIAKMQAELPHIATWDTNGRLLTLDATKAKDLDAAREFAQVVHRGVSQIIQGTFIGERSKWATDANMRLLTQFRSFGLTAIEKQYGRQVGNVGEVKAMGILLGSMCMVLPLYAARMQVQAVGRDDREEFLEQAFQPERVARQTMNYVAGSGLAGDFLDAMGALSGVDLGGGPGGKEQDFVGNVVMPAAGLFNDTYKALQNTEEGTDPKKFLKTLPFANLPHLGVIMRSLGDDD